jgi:hypothetical protein
MAGGLALSGALLFQTPAQAGGSGGYPTTTKVTYPTTTKVTYPTTTTKVTYPTTTTQPHMTTTTEHQTTTTTEHQTTTTVHQTTTTEHQTTTTQPHMTTTTVPRTTTTVPQVKIAFCHRTGSTNNPYVLLDTSPNAIIREGHGSHTGPIFPARGPDGKWGDIIPPFTFDSGSLFPGLNWPAGATILANGCMVPGGGTTTTSTTVAQTTTTQPGQTTTTAPGETTTTQPGETTTTLPGETTTTAPGIATLLTLRARVINTHGGQATVQDFELLANGPRDIAGTSGAPSVTLQSVPPGSYQLRDRVLLAIALGYISSGWSCTGSASETPTSVVLDAGEDAVCAITFSDTGAVTTTTAPGATTTAPVGGTTVPGSGTTVPGETPTTVCPDCVIPTGETIPASGSTFSETSPAPILGTPSSASSTLPFTGSDVRLGVGSGLLLLTVGGGVLLFTRRKKASRRLRQYGRVSARTVWAPARWRTSSTG